MFAVNKINPTFLGVPTIHLTESAARKMRRLVKQVNTEVGWLMVCNELDDGDFVLSDCVIPRQDVNGATTELTPQGLSEVGVALMNEDIAKGITPEMDAFRFNHLNAWFHSHATMGVSPSGQDDQQMVDFCQEYGDSHKVWIRGIVNKAGDIHLSVYYRCSKVWKVVTGCPVEIQWDSTGAIDTEIDAIIADRVKAKGTTTFPVVNHGKTYPTYNYRQRGKNLSVHRGVH